MTAQLCELQSFAHARIPLAAAMRLQFTRVHAGERCLRAPLGENVNHHGGAFGGNQYALAALAGWALARRLLAQAGLCRARYRRRAVGPRVAPSCARAGSLRGPLPA